MKTLVLIFFNFPFWAFAQLLPVGTSVVNNVGFESGYNFWTEDKQNTTLNTTTPLFGTQSLRLSTSPGGRAQIITAGIEPGATYNVSGYGNVSSLNDLATIGIEFKNAGGVNILDQWIEVYGNVTKRYSFDVKIPYGTTSMQLYVFKNYGNLPVDFDELNLVKVADP